MKYALLIYDNEAAWATRSEDEGNKLMQDFMAFTEDLAGSGKMAGGEALQPVSTATTVQVRDGKTVTTDGPFAETKEQLGGFYLVDAKDLDEATEIASRIPSSAYGTIEVRPVQEYPQAT